MLICIWIVSIGTAGLTFMVMDWVKKRPTIAPEAVKMAHARHGIWWAEHDGTKAYFYRNGKKCKL